MEGSSKDVSNSISSLVVSRKMPNLIALSDRDVLAKCHYFSPTSHWVIPNILMQGQNPTVGGSTGERIRTIREKGGCDTFVCLQAEISPENNEPSFGGIQTETRENEYSYSEEAFAVKGAPIPKFVHFGIEDFEPAHSLDELSNFVNSLSQRIFGGEVIYLHCYGGKGRAGLVAACLLGKLYPKMTAEESLKRIQCYCNLRNPGINISSPETGEQKKQVKDYFQLLLSTKESDSSNTLFR